MASNMGPKGNRSLLALIEVGSISGLNHFTLPVFLERIFHNSLFIEKLQARGKGSKVAFSLTVRVLCLCGEAFVQVNPHQQTGQAHLLQ